MRFRILLPLFLAAGRLCAQGDLGQAVLDGIRLREQRAHRCGVRAAGGDPGRGFDVKYHRLELTLDPAVQAVSGTVTTYFTATEELAHVHFDLDAALPVSSVMHHGVPIPFTHTADSLSVELPAPLQPGSLDSLRIGYAGVPDPSGFGSFITSTHDDVPVLWTLSEPYGAKDWWPCKQDLADKIDSIDLLVTHPAAYRAAANGLLLSEHTVDGSTNAHWRHRHPIAHYLIATAVTDYTVGQHVIDLGDVQVPMVSYAYPEHAEQAGWAVGDIQEQMPLFSSLFGTYPFADEQYGHAQFGWGGGMEHQTMSFLGVYHYELSAHELAHQWFGNKVTCGSWADIWLNEGFATYLTGLCYDFIGTDHWQGWKEAKVASITSEPDGSVFCPDTLSVPRLFSGRLTYNKAAMVLHMLRWICGDSAFFAGARNYLDDPELAFASARTSDLQQHLEASSGIDLDGFLADWFTGEGHPSYAMAWSQEEEGMVQATLHQAQSHASVDFFELPVPVRFSGNDRDTTVVFHHSFDGEAFSVQLPFTAHTAVIDPEVWLISAQNTAVQVPVIPDGPSLRPFPNPVSDRLWCAMPVGLDRNARITLVDATGRTAVEEQVAGRTSVVMELGALTLGTYFLRVQDAGSVHTAVVLKR